MNTTRGRVRLLFLLSLTVAGCASLAPRSDDYFDPNRPRPPVVDTPVIASPPAPAQPPARPVVPVVDGSGRLYALLIGISEYSDPSITRLAFAAKDAEDLAELLSRQPRMTKEQLFVLTDRNATKRNIEAALEGFLARAGPKDTILLYWSGHGYPDPVEPRRVYFTCYDTIASQPFTGYRMDLVRSLLEEKHARNKIVLADTCHAGKLITRGPGAKDERAIAVMPYVAQMAQEPDRIPEGMAFLVAADTDRKAVELSRWSNGAFTHILLRGLSGDADGFQGAGKKDGIVTLGELRAYMASQLPEQTSVVLGKPIHPMIAVTTGDEAINALPLVRVGRE